MFAARLLVLTATGLLGAVPAFTQQSTADADNAIPEIVVTATKVGAQSVQQTPLAISAFSANQIADAQISNVRDLMEYAPSLQVAKGTANAEIFIRGIGSTNIFAGSDPDVSVQVDGVYLARPSAQLEDFLDVDRVEILRGPQGTLYGRNAVGGTINVISRRPTDEFEARTSLTLGDYNLVQTQAYVSGPLLPERLQASLAVNFIRHDGYTENIAPGGHDIDDAERGSARGQLRAELTERIVATTRADWSSLGEHFESYSSLLAPSLKPKPALLANSTLGNYHEVALDFPQKETSHGGGVSEELDVELTSQLSVKSITAYRENRYQLTNDSDATELALSDARQSERQNQFSQEVTMQGRFERFDGVAGLYYLHENILANINNTTPAANTFRATQPHVDDDAPAIFAQGTFKLTPALHLTLGARYTEEEKKIFPNSFVQSTVSGKLLGPAFVSPAKATYSAFTPKFGIEWQASDQALIYASATRGYKSGGFNYAATSVAAQQFAPETIWSYEAGAKTDWLDRRLRVNLTGFRYNYTGLQVQTLLSPGVAFIGNAATARIKGAELEVTGKPIAGLTLISNTSFLDARYGSFPKATVPAGLVPYLAGNPAYSAATGAFNATGNTLTAAPRISTLAAVQYDHHLGSQSTLYGRVEYSWQGRTYYDPSNVLIMSQGPYGLLNAAVGFRGPSERWTTQILVKNITDKGYWITTAANGPVPLGNAGPPRTIWVSIARKW